jgi:hypothetical protein
MRSRYKRRGLHDETENKAKFNSISMSFCCHVSPPLKPQIRTSKPLLCRETGQWGLGVSLGVQTHFSSFIIHSDDWVRGLWVLFLGLLAEAANVPLTHGSTVILIFLLSLSYS